MEANKALYNPVLVEDEIEEYIYAYIVTKQDEGSKELYESGYFDDYYDVDSELIKEQIEHHGEQ